MKKHLVAFLSMIGLAGVAAPAQGQVLKGAGEGSSAKTESKIKRSKQSQENKGLQKAATIKLTNAAAEKDATAVQIQDKRKDKWAKADSEKKAAKANLHYKATKNETWLKGEKSTANSKLKLQHETLQKQNTAAGDKNAAGLTKAKGAQQK